MRAGCIVLCHALMRRRIQQGLNWANFAPSDEAFQGLQEKACVCFGAAETMIATRLQFEDPQMDAIFDDGVSDSV